MHLSLLSEPAIQLDQTPRPTGRAHRDGVLRGLVFLLAISIPLALAIVTGQAGISNAAAGYAQSFDARR